MVPSLQRAVKKFADLLQYYGHRCYLQRRGEGVRLTVKTTTGQVYVVTFYTLNDVDLAKHMFLLGYTAPTKS
jgi:hypothetical protein